MTIKFIELYAGVGGFRVGLENVDKDGNYVENVDGTQDGGSQEDTKRTSEVGGETGVHAGQRNSYRERTD